MTIRYLLFKRLNFILFFLYIINKLLILCDNYSIFHIHCILIILQASYEALLEIYNEKISLLVIHTGAYNIRLLFVLLISFHPFD